MVENVCARWEEHFLGCGGGGHGEDLGRECHRNGGVVPVPKDAHENGREALRASDCGRGYVRGRDHDYDHARVHGHGVSDQMPSSQSS